MAKSPLTVTKADTIKELQRELEMRKKWFPGWVIQGKLTAEVAQHRIACIEKAIEVMKSLDLKQAAFCNG
jgi:hypothetical protein